MAKQLNIDVNLNTAKASAQLKALQQMLQEAINSSTSKGTLTREIVSATEAATKLKTILNSSMNSKGNLDLSKFSANLKASGTTLTQYGQQLNNLGAAGQKAFIGMTKEIAAAQVPIKQTNTLTQSLFTSLKNTARWQFSSAMLHGVINTFHNAFSYARGLNESLNSIRIVTGLSADEMDRFAQSANNSAKALSASTLDYTDAALIYYQQGIRDQKQIKERTDATIKMANVTGDSAAKVSNQLTAIWNNFDKGGQNLEYYADVITALGAATASSSSEISAGLEKFASIAEETGLSYEYATSSLATIVATTRQSADVVGTALKTIFGRVQSLNLGETLEDGTTLGKYSQALEKVGINIKDQNGQLKDMDVILDEMGGKWETLNRDQKVAMAQAVAGARQYNQLMALMENYDFFKENVKIARGSEGTLEKQQEIYAESWQAARDRVKASWQGILDDVISDKFFIGLNNGFSGILDGVNKFIDAIGGIPGTLGLVSAGFMKLFQKPLQTGFSNLAFSIKKMRGDYVDEYSKMKTATAQALNAITPQKDSPKSYVMQAQSLQRSINLQNLFATKQQQIANAGLTISNTDRMRIQSLQELINLYGELSVKAQQNAEAEKIAADQAQKRLASQAETVAMNNILKANPNAQGLAIQTGLNAYDETLRNSSIMGQAYRNLIMAEEGFKTIGLGYSPMKGTSKAINTILTEQIQRNILTPYQVFKNAGYEIKRMNSNGKGGYQPLRGAGQEEAAYNAMRNNNMFPAGANYMLYQNGQKVLLNQRDHFTQQSINDPNLEKYKAWFAPNEKGRTPFERMMKTLDKASSLGLLNEGAKIKPEQEQLKTRAEAIQSDMKGLYKALNLNQLTREQEAALKIQFRGENGRKFFDAIRGEVTSAAEAHRLNKQEYQYTKTADSALRYLQGSQLGKGISDAAMGVANLSIGISSLTAGFKALNNESLSFGEKLLQTSMSFGMGISMITMGVKSIGPMLAGISTGVQALGTLLAGKGIGSLIGEGGLLTGTVAALKNALPAIIGIAAVIGTIALIKDFKEAKFAASSEGQLKSAQEQAAAMKQALADTQSAAENLKASFDNYNSIQNNLKSCIKGTQEWTQALRENNNEVINMLAQYPELANIEGIIQKDVDGALSFSEEGKEIIEKKMAQRVRSAEWASAQAQQEVLDKQIKANRVKEIGQEFKNLSQAGEISIEPEKNYLFSSADLLQQIKQATNDFSTNLTTNWQNQDWQSAEEIKNRRKELLTPIENLIANSITEQENQAKDVTDRTKNSLFTAGEVFSGMFNDIFTVSKEQAKDVENRTKDFFDTTKESFKTAKNTIDSMEQYHSTFSDGVKNSEIDLKNAQRTDKIIQDKINKQKAEEEKKHALEIATGTYETRQAARERKEKIKNTIADQIKDEEESLTLPEVLHDKDIVNPLENAANNLINNIATNLQNVDYQGAEEIKNNIRSLPSDWFGWGINNNAEMARQDARGISGKEQVQMIDLLGMSMEAQFNNNMDAHGRSLKSDVSFAEVTDAKEKGLNIISENWNKLMGLTVDEMGPALDKIFADTDISMVDSSAWAKELTTNKDLRDALNKNASSMMAAQTAQAAQEASTINEELIAQGFSKTDAETISNMLGQQGKLSELTEQETRNKNNELRKKDTNALALAREYIESIGGGTFQEWTKEGISYKDASGADQTATWDMMSSALGAAAALEQLGTSAQSAAQFLATLHSDDISDDTSKGVEEYLENGDFLNMKPEELVEQAGKSAEDISKELKKAFDEDTFKEATGKSIDEFAEAMENTAKGNLEAWNQMFGGMTEAQKEQMQGLNKYQEMSAGELISYYNRHFKDQELIKLPDLSEDVKTYAQLEEEVGTIDEAWGKVGNSIKNGTHLTQDMYDLFEALDVNAGDWGQFVDGDLITDAEGLIECLNEATNSTRDLIEHARQMDMITYDNLTEDLLNLVANTDDATRATDAFGDSLENILSQMDGLELSMAKYQQLQETLNGSTALFDQFDKAKTADAAADWSDEWSSAIQDINALISKGDYGGQAWQTGQQLLLPERLQGASAKETQDYISSLSNRGFITNEGKGQYDVTWDNAVNFANAALNTKLDSGNTVFSGSLSEGLKLDSSIKSLNDLAAAMDLSETSASALFSRLALVAHDGDSLWTQLAENAGDFGTQILTAEEEVATLGEKLNAARKAGNWEEYEQIKQQIQEAGAEVDKLKQKANQKVEFQLDLKNKLQEAETQVEKTTTEYERLKALAEQNPHNYGLQQAVEKARQEMEAAKKKWKELTGQIEDVSEFEIKIHLEKAYSQLQKLKETIKEVQNDTVVNGQHQRNEEVASKNIVDQYGHKIVTKKGLQDYSKAVEQKINVTVEATGADEVYADIKSRYEATKGEVEGNPAKIKANNTLALIKIAAAKAAATAFASGTYNASLTATDNTGGAIASATAKVLAFKALADSAGLFQGSAQFSGSAHERGSWGIKSNEKNALVGELGQELIVDPQTGRYYTVGDAGAELVDIPKGAIIFNHRQTEGLLKNRRINTRGQAYLQGSAFAGLPTIEAPPGKTLPTSPSPSPKPSPSPSPAPSPRQTPQTQKPKGAAADANGEILTYEEQLLNIIRDEVDEYANLERSITRLEHAYKNFTRNNDRLWGKALLENIQKSIDQGKKLYEAEYAKLEKRKDDYAKSTARLNSTNELQYQQKVLVGGTYTKDPKYNTQLITFQDFKGMDFLTGLGLLDESALQRGANGEVTGVNDVVAVDRAIEEYLRQKGIEANTLRTSKPGEEGEVAAENLMNNANAIAELLNKLLKEYTDSEADMLEQEEKTQDILEEIHDLAAQRITQEMEMRVQLQDNEKKLIDFAVKRIGDNPFRQAEKFIKQFKPSLFEDVPLRENGVIGTLIKKMDASIDAWNKANNQLALGQKDPHDKDAISLANWQDIAQKSFDEIMNDLNDLVDFINDMAEAFSKTAELGMAEIEKYTGRMEHTVSVLDHMGKLLDLTGRKYDYASRKTIIEGSMHNLENAWKEAEHWADLMTQQREASEQTYQELLTTDAEGAEWYKQNVLDKSYELEQDALEKMYTAAEDYMTKVEELWDVGLEEIMANWEEAATNGNGFDFLSDSMSKAKSIQEEYLTTTNKLYETNTLMRKVQQNIDKTDSKISKEKLASFNQEIKAAQEKNQLSVVEMEILKARYDLLEAQLALEEARDAKSIVRLQRDSEGNYGYVYTADQDDIDEKEQEVADKENDLYNLVLGYYNENQEKRIQVMQEYNAAAEQLYRDWHDRHLMSEDEYKAKLAELYDKANKKLLAIDENLAHSEKWLNITAATDVSEAWSHSFDDRIASTDRYMESFTKANEDTEKLMTKIDGIRDTVTKNAKLGLDDVTKKTDELTKKNDELAKQAEITSNKVADEMRAVDGLTASLAAQYTELQSLITAYYQYAQAMQAAMIEKGPEEAPSIMDTNWAAKDLEDRFNGTYNKDTLQVNREIARDYRKNQTWTANAGTREAINDFVFNEASGAIGIGGVTETSARKAAQTAGTLLEQASIVYGVDMTGWNHSQVDSFWKEKNLGDSNVVKNIEDRYNEIKKAATGATGMYTGEWGSEGKLAILHEKELVLNKDDTSNFLHALTIAKSNYEQMIQLQDLQSQYRSALFDSISNNIAAMFNKPSDTLQQEVTIHAEFPNATDHSEIEEAFSNLVNRAAQYASQSGWARDYENIVR